REGVVMMERRLKVNVAMNDWKEADDWQELKLHSKQFLLLMLISIVFIIVIGAAAYLRHSILSDQHVQASTLQVKEQQLQGMLAEELTYYRAHQQSEDFSLKNFSIWLLEQVTNVSLLNPSTIVSSELLYSTINEQSTLIHGGTGSDPSLAPQDHHQYGIGQNDGEGQGLSPVEKTGGEQDGADSQDVKNLAGNPTASEELTSDD